MHNTKGAAQPSPGPDTLYGPMTCPSCGRIAAAGLERCPSCHSSLAIPADRPDTPTPIVRAPTNRGELAQRARGIFAKSLVPRPPGEVPDPGATGRPTLLPPPPPPPALTVGEPPPAPPVLPVPPGRYHDPALAPSMAPHDSETTAFSPTAITPTALSPTVVNPTAVTPTVVNPTAVTPAGVPSVAAPQAAADPAGWATQPPPALATDPTAVIGALPPVEVTAAYPVTAAGPRDRHDPGREEDPTEERLRPVRPGVDAPWPPPPGPWSGRRTSES